MTEEHSKKEREAIINSIVQEVISRQKFSFLFWRQFFIGIAYGLGASIGAAAILGSVVYVYRNFLELLLERVI